MLIQFQFSMCFLGGIDCYGPILREHSFVEFIMREAVFLHSRSLFDRTVLNSIVDGDTSNIQKY